VGKTFERLSPRAEKMALADSKKEKGGEQGKKGKQHLAATDSEGTVMSALSPTGGGRPRTAEEIKDAILEIRSEERKGDFPSKKGNTKSEKVATSAGRTGLVSGSRHWEKG